MTGCGCECELCGDLARHVVNDIKICDKCLETLDRGYQSLERRIYDGDEDASGD